MADAFFTNRSLNYAKSFDEKITYIKNNTAPDKRDAIEITNFNKTIIERFTEGENNYCVYTSKTELKELEVKFDTVKECIPALEDKNALFYHADKSDKMDEGLQNINEVWSANNIVAVSPKITVGCSFTEKYFHNVFVKGCPRSCCVRDTFQSIN